MKYSEVHSENPEEPLTDDPATTRQSQGFWSSSKVKSVLISIVGLLTVFAVLQHSPQSKSKPLAGNVDALVTLAAAQTDYRVAPGSESCADTGHEAIDRATCKAACLAITGHNRYADGTWGHIGPGCFVVYNGAGSYGNCHWNQAKAGQYSNTYRALCSKLESPYSVAKPSEPCVKAVSRSDCKAACTAVRMSGGYNDASWAHIGPGCFVTRTAGGGYGNCHWNQAQGGNYNHQYRAICDQRKPTPTSTAAPAAASGEDYVLIAKGHRCANRAGLHGSNSYSRHFQTPQACYEYMSGTAGCGNFFNFGKDGWCDCVAEASGECIQVKQADSDVYKSNRKACLDKVPNCASFKADGLCEDSNLDNFVWRTDCVKTCGYCDDPVYTAPCPKGYCGPKFTKEEDFYHLITVTKIRSIKPSSSMDAAAVMGIQAVAALGAAAVAAAGCVATAGGGCAVAVPMIGKIAGGMAAAYSAAEAGGTAAGYAKTALKMIDAHYSGTDQLIVKINGQQVLPAPNVRCRMENGKFNKPFTRKVSEKFMASFSKSIPGCTINAGETITGKMSASFKNSATIQLMEYDAVSDNDDLGWLRVDPTVTPHGMEEVIVYSQAEGTLYEISYTLELGKGDKMGIAPFVQCGTVECRACDGNSCGDPGGLDRDGDKEDLKGCPSSYIHDSYKVFPQVWPFADVYLNICKLDPARKLALDTWKPPTN